MVMVVGNPVVGDSRVEKAAVAAYRAGYDVTVVGLIHRSVATLDAIDGIPVYRVRSSYAMHRWWRRTHDETDLETYTEAIDSRRELRLLHSRIRPSRRSELDRRIVSTTKRRSEDANLSIARTWRSLRAAISLLLARLPIRGIWRRAWPYIADLELASAEAIVDLQPDIIHVHDRHFLPGAGTAVGILRASGSSVKWIYDAHEWLPGVEFKGPKVHAAAWQAAESELIGGADAVITVSDELAEMLRARHGLDATPTVVTNAPPKDVVPADLGERLSVRDDCGLGADEDLLVYVGSIAEVRGPETVVRALTLLPGVHFALIAPSDVKRRRAIAGLAAEIGVGDRLHILDYVPALAVSSYISSASIGMSPVEPIENYQYSLQTKVREYLHAGLPIVGSRLKTLTRFLEESGVGEVHQPGDPEDCARVVKAVLANRNAYVESITEDLLTEHSWERQESILIETWDRLEPNRELPAQTTVSSPRLVVGPPVDISRSESLVAAVCRETDGSGEIIRQEDLVAESGRLKEKIDEYRRLVAFSDGLILESLHPLFGGLLGNHEDLLRHLGSARSLAFLLDPVAGVDPDELISRDSNCWLLALDASRRRRIARQGRLTRRNLNDTRTHVFATSPLPMPEMWKVTWLPTVVDIVEREPNQERPLRVVVAPGPRGGDDALVPEAVSRLASPLVEVLRPAPGGDLGTSLLGADLLVDSLGHGSYTDTGARAMGYGCVVISSIDDEAAGTLGPSCPVIDASPDLVTDMISDLAADRARLSRLSKESLAYAMEVHDGVRTARSVVQAMGWSS